MRISDCSGHAEHDRYRHRLRILLRDAVATRVVCAVKAALVIGSGDMRQIGLVGDLSWVSTVEYYRLINRMVREQLGGHRSARVLLDSLDEQAVLDAQRDDPSEAGCEAMIVGSVARLAEAGSEVIAVCANGLHRIAPGIESATGVAVVDIAEATAHSVAQAGLRRVGLLGVRKTMECSFYRERLEHQDIGVVVPEDRARAYVHDAIVNELRLGRFTDQTRAAFLDIGADLINGGAEGVIFGCTEIPLLLDGTNDVSFPMFSTTAIHCEAILSAALAP